MLTDQDSKDILLQLAYPFILNGDYSSCIDNVKHSTNPREIYTPNDFISLYERGLIQ